MSCCALQAPRREHEDFAAITDEDRLALASVDLYLERGLDLRRWWDEARAGGALVERFPLGRTFNRPDSSYGFFGEAPVQGQLLPVMGNFQEMFYDQPKSPNLATDVAAGWMRDQMREFVLHYFLRISSFRQPQGYLDEDRPAPPFLLRPFSLCENEGGERLGFGFSQLFYKRRDSGEIGTFPAAERFAIVDLRAIGTVYEWVLAKVRIFDFNIDVRPLGSGAPYGVVPLQEDSYVLLARPFLLHEEDPEPGVLGRYGFGYAFIKNPTSGLLAYGPGEFDAAIEMIDFHVLATGEVRAVMSFVVNRPERIVNLSLNPLDWGLRFADLLSGGAAGRLLSPNHQESGGIDPVFASIALLNLLTGGRAASDLCISREQLEKRFLVTHFMQHYTMITGSLLTWRQIRDWLDSAALPRWVLTGEAS